MKFVKMHGCGNDYVYLDGVSDPAIARRIGESGWAESVQRMSDRHKGIGSDGVIVLCPPTAAAQGAGAHVRMRMFNADGSESEMCGNGVRCVAKFAHDRLGVSSKPMLVETGRGVLSIEYEVVRGGKLTSATVDMGEPILDLDKIPVDRAHVVPSLDGRYSLKGIDGIDTWMFVSMGNPHAIVWQSLGAAPSLARSMGSRLEHHPAFPRRANIHFAAAESRGSAQITSWERGAGITQACGTGACAALVSGVLCGRLDRAATIKVLGGELRIRWDERSNHVFMTGEAVDVFEGEWPGRDR
jgi:diaminopimelate epimerase